MLDNLGFHTDRDIRTELADTRRQLAAAEARLAIGDLGTYEATVNNASLCTTLTARAATLTIEAAQEDDELRRLADAIARTGDFDLAVIAYIALGPTALPMAPRYEVRLIERRGGCTVPDGVRRNVPADQVTDVQRELLTWVTRYNGHAALWGHTVRDYRTQTTAY
ncbi:hypothetical protein ACIBCO_35990 [Streptomyces violascens]|uniref:hypothetical protein n=1 Tax=Streptomyces violascens TaxID=67381 RepID=UPI0037ADD574